MELNILGFEQPMLGVTFRALFEYDQVQALEANSKWDIGGTTLEGGEILFTVRQAYEYIQSRLEALTIVGPSGGHDDHPDFLIKCIRKIPHLISIQNAPNSPEWCRLLLDDAFREAQSPHHIERGWHWSNGDARDEGEAAWR